MILRNREGAPAPGHRELLIVLVQRSSFTSLGLISPIVGPEEPRRSGGAAGDERPYPGEDTFVHLRDVCTLPDGSTRRVAVTLDTGELLSKKVKNNGKSKH